MVAKKIIAHEVKSPPASEERYADDDFDVRSVVTVAAAGREEREKLATQAGVPLGLVGAKAEYEQLLRFYSEDRFFCETGLVDQYEIPYFMRQLVRLMPALDHIVLSSAKLLISVPLPKGKPIEEELLEGCQDHFGGIMTMRDARHAIRSAISLKRVVFNILHHQTCEKKSEEEIASVFCRNFHAHSICTETSRLMYIFNAFAKFLGERQSQLLSSGIEKTFENSLLRVFREIGGKRALVQLRAFCVKPELWGDASVRAEFMGMVNPVLDGMLLIDRNMIRLLCFSISRYLGDKKDTRNFCMSLSIRFKEVLMKQTHHKEGCKHLLPGLNVKSQGQLGQMLLFGLVVCAAYSGDEPVLESAPDGRCIEIKLLEYRDLVQMGAMAPRLPNRRAMMTPLSRMSVAPSVHEMVVKRALYDSDPAIFLVTEIEQVCKAGQCCQANLEGFVDALCKLIREAGGLHRALEVFELAFGVPEEALMVRIAEKPVHLCFTELLLGCVRLEGADLKKEMHLNHFLTIFFRNQTNNPLLQASYGVVLNGLREQMGPLFEFITGLMLMFELGDVRGVYLPCVQESGVFERFHPGLLRGESIKGAVYDFRNVGVNPFYQIVEAEHLCSAAHFLQNFAGKIVELFNEISGVEMPNAELIKQGCVYLLSLIKAAYYEHHWWPTFKHSESLSVIESIFPVPEKYLRGGHTFYGARGKEDYALNRRLLRELFFDPLIQSLQGDVPGA